MGKCCFGKQLPQAITLGHIVRFFARMDVASILILLVLMLAGLGSCFPQRLSSMATDAAPLVGWQDRVRRRYGGLTGPLLAVGAFRWFRSPLFLLAAGFLVLGTFVCTTRRWRGVWRRSLRRPVRCSEAEFERAAYRAELKLPSAAGLTAVVRAGLTRRGFSVRCETDDRVTHVRGDRNALGPMATLLTHVAVLGLALGVAASSAWGWREELTLAPGETVDVGMGSGWRRNPAAVAEAGKGLQVRNVGFTVTRYADSGVAGYHAEVDLSEGGSETIRGHIRLNQPLTYHGIAFTLQRYTALDQGYLVTLSAGRDPGYAVVIAAGLMMFVGLAVSFNCPQCCIYVRMEGEGRLRLAGHADRRAWSFDRGFTALVEEIDRVGRTLGGHDNRCSR